MESRYQLFQLPYGLYRCFAKYLINLVSLLDFHFRFLGLHFDFDDLHFENLEFFMLTLKSLKLAHFKQFRPLKADSSRNLCVYDQYVQFSFFYYWDFSF